MRDSVDTKRVFKHYNSIPDALHPYKLYLSWYQSTHSPVWHLSLGVGCLVACGASTVLTGIHRPEYPTMNVRTAQVCPDCHEIALLLAAARRLRGLPAFIAGLPGQQRWCYVPPSDEMGIIW